MHHLNRCMLKLQKHKLEEKTRISSPVNATEKPSGSQPPSNPKLITNPPNTFSIVCPAIMFANNLTDKLTGLLK